MNQHDRWLDGIAARLIRHAARKAPPTLSERLSEEWLADLSARSGTLSQLRFALGCCWATNVIAHEFGAPVGAAGAAAGNKTTVVGQAGYVPSFSRRTMVILLIVGLHVLVVCVLATAIEAPNSFKPIADRMHADFLPQPVPRIPPSLPPDPRLTQFRPDVSPPKWPEPPPEPPTAIRDSVSQAPPAGPAGPASPKPGNRVLGGPGAGFPNADDFYPEASRRLGEKGITTVSVCVDGTGRLIGKPTVDRSSGSARLDESALRLAQAGSGHYRVTTEDGRPVSACYPFHVRFQLRD